MSTKRILRNGVVTAAVLATSPVWAKGSGGGDRVGKSTLGYNHLSLDVMPGYNAVVCTGTESLTKSKSGSNLTPNNLALAIDPFGGSRIELTFTVSDVLAQNNDSVLILVYSSATSPTPQIPTPTSKNKFHLDLAPLEILAMYDIPAQSYIVQNSTRLGAASPAPRSKVSFSVNLDTGTLPSFINNSEKAYLQAALISRKDFDRGAFENMILSELETLEFVKYTCPQGNSSVSADAQGNLTYADAGGSSLVTRYNDATKTKASGSVTTKTKTD